MRTSSLFILTIFLLLPVGFAFEFDNVLQTKDTGGKYPELTIVNSLGLGDDIAKFKLIENTDLCINTCYAIINITLYESAKLPFNFDFIETTDRKEKMLNYNVYTRHAVNKDVSIPTYTEVCRPYVELNETLNNNCTLIQNGTVIKKVLDYEYTPYNDDILPPGQYTIKIQSKINERNFSIDWGFNLLGISSDTIREHWAVWSASLEVNLQRYYNFTSDAEYLYGAHNFTALEAYPTFEENNALKYKALNLTQDHAIADILNGGDKIFQFQYPEMSMNFWWRRTVAVTGDDSLLGDYMGSGTGWYVTYGTDHALTYQYWCTGLTTNLGDRANKYFMATVVKNITGAKLYINGTLAVQCNFAGGEGFNKTSTKGLAIGTYGDDASANNPSGMMDELSFYNRTLSSDEILDLYNGGLGLTIGDTSVSTTYNFTIDLKIPANSTSFIKNNYTDFIWNITTNNTILYNSTLYIWNTTSLFYTSPIQTYTGVNLSSYYLNSSWTLYPKFDLDKWYYWNVYARGQLYNGTFVNVLAPINNSFKFYSFLLVNSVLPANDTTLINTNTTTLKSNITFSQATLNNYSIFIWARNDSVNYNIYRIINSSIINNQTDLNVIYNISLDKYQDYMWNIQARAQLFNGTYITAFGQNRTINTRLSNITSIIYSPTTYETQNETFKLNFTYSVGSYESIDAYLNFDGTTYTADASSNISDLWNFNKTIDIPLILTNATAQNKSFYWQLKITNSTGYTYLNSSINNVSVERIYLQNCTEPINTSFAYNFTAYNEITNARISPFTMSGTMTKYYIGSGTVYKNESFHNLAYEERIICISPDSINLKTEGHFTYSNSTYETRDYYIVNGTASNTTHHIKLYLLPSASSTTFIIKVQDINQLPLPDYYVYIQRYDAATDTYLTVQTVKTDDNGKTVGFYETETVYYRHIITDSYGNIKLTTSKQKIFPEDSPYTLVFTIGDEIVSPWDIFENMTNATYGLSYNKNTKIVTYSYVDSDADFEQGRLLVQKLNPSTKPTTICNITSLINSATLSCNLSSNTTGSYIAYSYLTRDGIETNNYILRFEITTDASVFGIEGLFLGWFIILTTAMIFIFNKIAGVIMVNIAFLLVRLFGLIEFSALFLFSIIGISAIILVLLKREGQYYYA